ncbi:hypothetical protein BFP70_02800 [Thioclava sp. SK-1]|nr:hypothetical protein BFP70_02800 [Thioclava sp. SK-1]
MQQSNDLAASFVNKKSCIATDFSAILPKPLRHFTGLHSEFCIWEVDDAKQWITYLYLTRLSDSSP